jgi:hypothetical protein
MYVSAHFSSDYPSPVCSIKVETLNVDLVPVMTWLPQLPRHWPPKIRSPSCSGFAQSLARWRPQMFIERMEFRPDGLVLSSFGLEDPPVRF